MVAARHNKLFVLIFNLYVNWILSRRYRNIEFRGEIPDTEKPILLISNHISWWDGFWNYYFTIRILKRKFHVMIADPQIKKHRFMNRVGGYSVKKGSRNILESLDYTLRLLADCRNLVLVYPQGRIASVYENCIRFQKGISYLQRNLQNNVSVVMVAYFTETGIHKKDALWGYFKECPACPDIEKAYQSFYNESLSIHIKNVSE